MKVVLSHFSPFSHTGKSMLKEVIEMLKSKRGSAFFTQVLVTLREVRWFCALPPWCLGVRVTAVYLRLCHLPLLIYCGWCRNFQKVQHMLTVHSACSSQWFNLLYSPFSLLEALPSLSYLFGCINLDVNTCCCGTVATEGGGSPLWVTDCLNHIMLPTLLWSCRWL